ncbi:MAG: Transcriptional regulator [Pseudomonadota bacterium]|jgi:AcrR family transcriptional regulator
MRNHGKPPAPGPFSSPPVPVPDPDPALSGARMRTVPRQQRARAAVNRILRATGELLDDAGFDALTTTAVAERAGVNIATLYRYFPDKFALIEALALAIETERYEKVGPMLAAFGTSADWRKDLRAIFEKLLDLRVKRIGVRGLRRALHSAPQLWVTERQGFARMAERLSTAMRTRVPTLTQPRAELIAVTMLTMLIGLLDQAMLEPAQRRAVVREGSTALERYLAPYLD